MYIEKTLAQFASDVAEKTAVPGGGSVSAYASTLGAALGAMAARYTEGDAAARAAGALDGLRARLLEFVDRDSTAYAGVSTAMKLPKKTDEEKARRKAAVQEALAGAADVPLQAMRLAVEALGHLDAYAAACNRNLVSDLVGGALLLSAGLEGCSHNVRVNAGALTDPAKASALEAECAKLLAEGSARASSARAKAERAGRPS